MVLMDEVLDLQLLSIHAGLHLAESIRENGGWESPLMLELARLLTACHEHGKMGCEIGYSNHYNVSRW